MNHLPPLERRLVERLDVEASVRFMFRKSDGSIREACGTRNLRFIPSQQHPKEIHALYGNAVTYYDWKRKDWRSWTVGSVIQVFE